MVLEKKKKHISIRKEFSEKIFTPACMANPNWLYHQYLRSCDSLVTLVLAENTFDLSQIILWCPRPSPLLNSSVSHRRHSASHQQRWAVAGIIGNIELGLGLLYSLFFVASDVHLVHLVSLKTWEERSQPWWTWWWGRRGPWACCCWPSSPPSFSGCPGPSQNSNGVNPSALCVTLLASCRSDPFKGLVHAATACSMAHQPVPWGVLLRSARIKVHCVEVTESSSVFYQHSNFSNCI